MPLPRVIRPIRTLARLLAVVAVVAIFGVGMSVFLSYFKFASAVGSAARSRMQVPAVAVREGVQASLALGLALNSGAGTRDLLAREALADPEIAEISVFDQAGQVFFSTEPSQIGRTVAADWIAAAGRAAGAEWHVDGAGEAVVGLPLRNSFDLTLGQVAVRYRLDTLQQALARMRSALLGIALAGWSGILLMALVLLARVPASRRALQPAAILLAVTLGLAGVSWATQSVFESLLRPELERKAAVVGASVGELLGKALASGVPFVRLVAVERYLADLRIQHPELEALALRDAGGALRFQSGPMDASKKVSVPFSHDGKHAGSVDVSVSAGFIHGIVFESLLDLLAVLVVAVFLTRELLEFIATTDPSLVSQAADDASLQRVRAPLFLFMLAEELTRAFLPGHAHALLGPVGGVSRELLVGLPIVVFMLVVALGQPVLASWSERIGHRRAMQSGAALGVLALGGAALAGGILGFIGWRALCGLAYAIVFVAGQGYVIAHTGTATRTRGFALFVAAIMVAAVCGPPVGGILADHVGARWGFAAAALLALLASFAVRCLPRDAAPGADPAFRAPAAGDFLRLLGARRFVVITLLAAVPAKLILAGFCFYLVPLYVVSLGVPPSVAGRALMLYAVTLVLVLPHATRRVEGGTALARLVATGLCVSALGGFGLLAGGGVLAVYSAMVILGFGQGLSIAAQSSLLSLACAAEIRTHGNGPVFGVYRLIERLGNAGGPLLAALLVAWLGYAQAFAAISALVLGCGVLFGLLFHAPQAVEAQEAAS